MRELGTRLGRRSRPGDLILLNGPLGAGKTVLTQGIGAGLGVPDPVTSPTFVLARLHRGGRVPLLHVDAYRLRAGPDGQAQLDDLDLDADIAASVTVVEWGMGLAENLAADWLEVGIDRPDPDRPGDDNGRRVTLRSIGDRWNDVAAELAEGMRN
jgi:tRNA threonylcarbamoyladenosine biosynthesis protein TsaE